MASELKLTEQLAELERLEQAATPGRWYVVGPPWRPSGCCTYIVAGHSDPHAGTPVVNGIEIDEWPAEQSGPDYDQSDADLAYIATLRNLAPALIAAAKRDQNRSNAYADLPGVGRVSHADAHDMAIRFIRRHFDGDRCEKMPLTSIPADPSRDHDIRLLAYIEQQAETEARATAAEARVGELTKALEELYSASCDQQFTLNSRGWNKHPDDASGKNDWAISGAHRHQFDRVQRAVDAADRVLHPEDVEDIARTAPKPQGEERT